MNMKYCRLFILVAAFAAAGCSKSSNASSESAAPGPDRGMKTPDPATSPMSPTLPTTTNPAATATTPSSLLTNFPIKFAQIEAILGRPTFRDDELQMLNYRDKLTAIVSPLGILHLTVTTDVIGYRYFDKLLASSLFEKDERSKIRAIVTNGGEDVMVVGRFKVEASESTIINGMMNLRIELRDDPATDPPRAESSSPAALSLPGQHLDYSTIRQSKVLTGHTDSIRALAISPDGKTLASGSGNEDRSIRLWDLSTGQQTGVLLGHQFQIWTLGYRNDGKALISGSSFLLESGELLEWDLSTQKSHNHAALEGVFCVGWSPDGMYRAFTRAKNIHVVKTTSTSQPSTGPGVNDDSFSLTNDSRVNKFAFSPDCKLIASANADGSIRIWDLSMRKELRSLTGHTETVLKVAFSPDGKSLVSGSGDRTIRLWDVASGQTTGVIAKDAAFSCALAFGADGKAIAYAADKDLVKIWSLQTRQIVASLEGHSQSVWSIVFSPDGRILASAGVDREIRIWNVPSR